VVTLLSPHQRSAFKEFINRRVTRQGGWTQSEAQAVAAVKVLAGDQRLHWEMEKERLASVQKAGRRPVKKETGK
jgi:hypothetical protein